MLKIQEFISMFDTIEEACLYLRRNLYIESSSVRVGGEGTGSYGLWHFRAGQRADLTNPLVREAHCLILYDDGDLASRAWKRPVVVSNPDQVPISFDLAKAICEEVPDGVVVVIYNIEGKWHVSTTDTIDGDEYLDGIEELPGMTYEMEVKSLLNRRFGRWDNPFKNTNPFMSFIFNYVSPYNRCVMPILGPELYLTAVMNVEAGTELSNGMVDSLATSMSLPKRHWTEINGMTSLSNRLQNMRALAPGLMLRDIDNHRIFIPNPIHNTVRSAKEAGDRCRPSHIAKIVQVCRDKGDVTAISAAYENIGPMMKLLWDVRDQLWKELLILWSTARKTTIMKDFAEVVQHHPLNYMLFMMKDGSITSFREAISTLKPIRLARLAKNKWEKEYETASRLLKFTGGKANGVEKESGIQEAVQRSSSSSGEEEGCIPYAQEGD